jgi:hypothetical protein
VIDTYQIDDISIRPACKDEGYEHTAINVISYIQRTLKLDPLDHAKAEKQIREHKNMLGMFVRHIPNVYFASVPDFKSPFPIPDSPGRQLTGFANSSIEKDSLVLEFIATVRSLYPTGSALMGFMIAQAKDINAVDLQTQASSADAFDWFENLGFRLINSEGAMRLRKADFANTLEVMSNRTKMSFC